MGDGEESFPVTLRVYDLSLGMAKAMSLQLTGKQFDLIPHTGVEVYGVEYFFGGGVQALPPATVEATFGLKPCEVLPLGSTAIPKEVFEDFLQEIAPRFTSETYNLFTHNCNNFSNVLDASLCAALLDGGDLVGALGHSIFIPLDIILIETMPIVNPAKHRAVGV